jgi:hypothetical protein
VWQKKCAAEKVRQKKCGRKSEKAEKVWQKKCGRKSVAEKCGRKSVAEKSAEKVRQKKCGKKSQKNQQNRGSRMLQEEKRYGFHMCSVEFMNLVEGFPCKSVGCPLGSLGLVVELI